MKTMHQNERQFVSSFIGWLATSYDPSWLKSQKTLLWDLSYTSCYTTVKRWYANRLVESALSCRNGSWCFDDTFVVLVLVYQLYFHTDQGMCELINQHIPTLEVNYVSYNEVCFRKRIKSFTTLYAVDDIKPVFENDFAPS